MKNILKILTITALTLSFTGLASAQSTPNIQVADAYNKGSTGYDVVVKDPSGTKLRLYVNDKNPISATGNKKGWATFHKVPLKGQGKLSFTQVQKRHNGSTYEVPVNYTTSYNGDKGKVIFSSVNSSPASVVTLLPPKIVTPAAHPVQSAPQATQPIVQSPPTPNTGITDTNLSNANTYTNVDGTTVHSPAASTDGAIPVGATAQCSDGTYSFSQNHSGTCSRHGGVSRWL